MTKSVISIAAICMAAGAAFADRPAGPIHRLVDGHYGPGGADGPGTGLVTGFEVADGFNAGPMHQNGWTGLGAGNIPGLGNGASISTVNPFAGQQHLRLGEDGAVGLGTPSGTQTPSLGFGPAATTTSMRIFIPTDAYADYNVVGLTDTTNGAFSFAINFSFTGSVFVNRSVGDGGNVNLGPIVYNQWTDLTVGYNSSTNQMSVSYNGNNVYSGVGGFGSLAIPQTAFDALGIYSDNFQDPGEFADFDNVSIVPAPGSLALLGVGGLFAARRRRA